MKCTFNIVNFDVIFIYYIILNLKTEQILYKIIQSKIDKINSTILFLFLY